MLSRCIARKTDNSCFLYLVVISLKRYSLGFVLSITLLPLEMFDNIWLGCWSG